MAAHGAGRVAEGSAVLDLEPVDGVGVVAAPDLGAVVEHTRVEPAAAAGAPLEQHLGEVRRQAAQQVVQAQHIAVGRLALALGGQHAAVHVGHVAVHVPLDVGDVVPGQQTMKCVV